MEGGRLSAAFCSARSACSIARWSIVSAHANSSDRIARPIGIRRNAGPGVTSMISPMTSDGEPGDDVERPRPCRRALKMTLALGLEALARGSARRRRCEAIYSGMLPCLRFGPGSRLVSSVSSAVISFGRVSCGHDHVVDVAALGRRVRVGEARLVVVHQLLAALVGRRRAGDVAAVDDVDRALGAHHGDLGLSARRS